MTTTAPVERFRSRLACQLAARETVPLACPLVTSPWISMSLLQKAIRRGETAHALRAAATLLRDAPERLWRRCGGIAFEDIGVGDLETVGLVTAALEGKRLRRTLGGEWAVASLIVLQMCSAPKSRASDDLLMSALAMPSLSEARSQLGAMSEAKLHRVALGAPDLHHRALALHYFLGTQGRPVPALTARKGNPALTFATLEEMGVAPTVVALAREGVKKTGEVLPLLVALLTVENGVRDGVCDDQTPPETRVGEVPSWALDTYTREGRSALAGLLKTDAPVARFAREETPSQGRVDLLGQALFRVEGGLLRRRVGGPTGERLRALMEIDSLRVSPDQAHRLMELMRHDLPVLNEVRAHVAGRA